MEKEMNRRDFLEFLGKGTFALGVSTLGLSSLISCGEKKSNVSKKINVNGVEYQIKNGILSQTKKGDGKIKLGVMTDLHAHKENSQ